MDLNQFQIIAFGADHGNTGLCHPIAVNSGGYQYTRTILTDDNEAYIGVTPADGFSPTAAAEIPVFNFPGLYNGATFDRQRNNTEVTVLASTARTLATTSADLVNYNARGLHLIINVSAYTSGSLVPTLEGKDPISGNYYSILVGTGIGATGITILKCYPGIQSIVGAAAADILPRTWRVSCSAVNATYSISAALIV